MTTAELKSHLITITNKCYRHFFPLLDSRLEYIDDGNIIGNMIIKYSEITCSILGEKHILRLLCFLH